MDDIKKIRGFYLDENGVIRSKEVWVSTALSKNKEAMKEMFPVIKWDMKQALDGEQ